MFTKKQLSFLEKSNNYQVIRLTDDYIEFRSRNTWHCWIIKKEPDSVRRKYPYTVYHKHKSTDCYHRHWQAYSVEKCVESIADQAVIIFMLAIISTHHVKNLPFQNLRKERNGIWLLTAVRKMSFLKKKMNVLISNTQT